MDNTQAPVAVLDPSNKFRPEKKEAQFRDFTTSSPNIERVKNIYYPMHTHQSYDFVTEKFNKWCKFDHKKSTILDALESLNALVDECDPDCDVPNSYHAFQTAERIREAHPDEDWFHLTGLVHDLGKILSIYGEPQWCVVGDTFPVGCAFDEECVFGKESFRQNKDYDDPRYNTRLGVYEENCGLENVLMSWGHDSYLYEVLKNHPTCILPEEALYMIRFHSFYPWHTGGAYNYLCDNKDREMMPWVLEFNKFDLYSKSDHLPNIAELLPYYQSLVEKYIPGEVAW